MLILSIFGLSTAEKMIRDLQSEDYGVQDFLTKIKNVVNYIALLSSEEQVSLLKEGFEA